MSSPSFTKSTGPEAVLPTPIWLPAISQMPVPRLRTVVQVTVDVAES
jgi:hypothetical protein